MSTFLDDLLKKMKTAPHVGIPPVTNPKLPTKVEKDAAAYAARQKEMPNFKFGSDHPTPTYADPAFNKNNNKNHQRVIDEAVFDAEFQAYLVALRAQKKQKEKME